MSEKAFEICAPLVLRAVLLRGPQEAMSFLQPSLVAGMGEGSSLALLRTRLMMQNVAPEC